MNEELRKINDILSTKSQEMVDFGLALLKEYRIDNPVDLTPLKIGKPYDLVYLNVIGNSWQVFHKHTIIKRVETSADGDPSLSLAIFLIMVDPPILEYSAWASETEIPGKFILHWREL